MSKLILTCGISGSGKSTFTSTIVKHNPIKYFLVNRDKIRESIFGYTEENISEYYLRDDFNLLEKEVTKTENALIKEGLSKGKIVIVDATHLKKEYIDRFRFFNVDTDIIYFDIGLEEAIRRDSNRIRKVGAEIIKRQYNRYNHIKTIGLTGWQRETLVQDLSLMSCVIFDIDGTLAHKENRDAYDWGRVGEDKIDNAVEHLWKSIDGNFTAKVFCTGRDSICKKETEQWLYKHGVGYYDELHMRTHGDNRPDWIVKREMWEDISKRYNILFLVDDRNQVVDYARSLGLKVFQVENGNF